jgi:hypothetical protein
MISSGQYFSNMAQQLQRRHEALKYIITMSFLKNSSIVL